MNWHVIKLRRQLGLIPVELDRQEWCTVTDAPKYCPTKGTGI